MPHKDPEKAQQYHRDYYVRRRAQRLAAAAKYRAEHPEKAAACRKRCYDRVKQKPTFLAARKKYQKERRAKNREAVRAIERASYYRNREKVLGYQKSQEGTPKRLARSAIRRAIQKGVLPSSRTLACKVCEGPAREYHHFNGYAKEHWLDVIPVCHQCHKDIHASV